MATEAQIAANQANARKSTGPQTPEGKAKVAQNAVKHGLRAQTAVLEGEDQEEYVRLGEALRAELSPRGPEEEYLARRIVDLTWRLQRAGRCQSEVFTALYEQYVAERQSQSAESATSDSDAGVPGEGASWLGQMLVQDFSGPRILERLLAYERRIESSLCRATGQLREKQQLRLLGGPVLVSACQRRDDARGREPSGQTDPRAEESPNVKCQVSSGKPALRTSNSRLDTSAAGPPCRTNSIPAGGPRLEDFLADKQSQFALQIAPEVLSRIQRRTR